MNFIQYDLGSMKSGEIVEVTLTAAVNRTGFVGDFFI